MIEIEQTENSEKTENTDALTAQLASLQSQVERLTQFLISQDETKSKRRRRLTIRTLLIAVAMFAIFFAWLSSAYRESLQHGSAVDELISQGAFVMYEPRDSLAVSILPGDPNAPPKFLAKGLGIDFFRSATNVSTNTRVQPKDKKRILPALSSLTDLQRLRLTKLSLTTADLNSLASLTKLKSLDVTRTRLDNGSLPWVRKTNLEWINASHTWLGDRMMYDLSLCEDLKYVNMERTTVTDAGLKHLHGRSSLTYLNLKRCPVTLAAVKRLSDTIPNCVIEWEPLLFRQDGKVNIVASRRAAQRLGRGVAVDPRGGPVAPSDTKVDRNQYIYFPSKSSRRNITY